MPPEARSRKARFYVLRTSAFPYATHRATLLKSFLEGKHFVLEKSWEQHPSATMGIHPHSGDARLQQTAVIPYCHQQTHSLKKGEEQIIPSYLLDSGLWSHLVWYGSTLEGSYWKKEHTCCVMAKYRLHWWEGGVQPYRQHPPASCCADKWQQFLSGYFRKPTSQYLWISVLMESKGLCFIAAPVDTDEESSVNFHISSNLSYSCMMNKSSVLDRWTKSP